jgi:hypothetical protein
MSENYIEVRNDYTDDNGYTYIDVYLNEDENYEEGKTVAVVCQDTGKVFFIDNDWYNNPLVLEAIEEVKPKPKTESKLAQLKKEAEGFKNTLILYLFEVVRLVDVIEDEDDIYWVYERADGEIVHVSCLIDWIPLKKYLKESHYRRMITYWNLNSDNKVY